MEKKENKEMNQAAKFLRKNRNNRRWLMILSCLAVIVAGVTLIALTMPGQATTKKNEVLNCQYQAHVHTDECYNEEGNLICGKADYAVHVHMPDCYDTNGNLVCPLPEIKEHTHTEECYETQKVLICGKEESEGHKHDDSCYIRTQGDLICQETAADHVHTDACYEWTEQLICGQEEGAGAHTHTDECYKEEKTLTCGKLELHTHTADCYAVVDEDADEATIAAVVKLAKEKAAAVTESTAPAESDLPTTEPGKKRILICGKTELERHQHDVNCYSTMEDMEAEAEANAAANTEVPEATEAADTEAERNIEKVYEDEGLRVTAAYSEQANIPEDAELRVKPVAEDSDKYKSYQTQVKETLESGTEPDNMLVYDIGFYKDDEEIEPTAPVTVTIQFLDENGFAEGDPVTIVHFTDDGTEVIEGSDVNKDNATTFEADSFSDYAIIPKYSFISGKLQNGTMPTALAGGQSSDLGDFLEGVIIKDADGNVVEAGSTLYVGDTYNVDVTFSEIDDVYNGRQFANGILTWNIPQNLQVENLPEQTKKFTTKDGKESEFKYWVQNGKLYVQFKDSDTVNVDSIRDLRFNLSLNAKLTADSDDDILDIPVGDDGHLDFAIDKNPKPSIEKEASAYNPETGKVDYTVKIRAEHGDIKDLKFSDTLRSDPNALKFADPLEVEITIKGADGKETTHKVNLTGDDRTDSYFNLDTWLEGKTLADGEEMTIKYSAEVKTDQTYDCTQKNKAVLKGTGKGSFEVSDKQEVEVNTKLYEKTADKQTVNGEELLRWKVRLGNGYGTGTAGADFCGQTVRDTLGGGDINFYTSDEGIVLRVYDAETGEYSSTAAYVIPWKNVTFSNDGKTIEYKLPTLDELKAHYKNKNRTLPENFYFVAVYYTKYKQPAPGEKITYTNSVTTSITNYGKPEEGSYQAVGPLGSIDKIVQNPEDVDEDRYVEYQVSMNDIVANATGKTQFRFKDVLTLTREGGEKLFVENVPVDLEVYLITGEGEENRQLLPFGDKSKPNYYFIRLHENTGNETEINRFYLVFNTDELLVSDTRTYIETEPSINFSVLVKYKVSLDAPVYLDEFGAEPVDGYLTLGDYLNKGYTLKNEASRLVEGENKDSTVNYKNPKFDQTVSKIGELQPDGTILYRVEFKNFDKDGKPLLDTKDAISSMVLHDEFDDKLEYVEGSLQVDSYNVEGTKLHGSYKFSEDQNIVKDNPDKNTSYFDAPIGGFDTRLRAGGAVIGDYNDRTYYETLEEALWHRIGYDDDGYKANPEGALLVFTYKLRVKKDVFNKETSSEYKLHNDSYIETNKGEYADSFDFDYKTGVMTKTAEQQEGNPGFIDFTITLNPHKQKLIPDGSKENTLTLVDKMSDNVSLQGSTIKVMGDGADVTEQIQISWNEDTHEMTLKNLKDETSYVITYTVRLTEAGSSRVTNEAKITGNVHIEGEVDQTFEVKGTDAGATGSVSKITLIKQDSETDEALAGAKFLLYVLEVEPNTDPREGSKPVFPTKEAVPSVKDYTEVYDFKDIGRGYFVGMYETPDNGRVVIDKGLMGNAKYVLVEIEAPSGYMTPEGKDAWNQFQFKVDYKTEETPIDIKILRSDSLYAVDNTPYNFSLPETGGDSPWMYTLCGLLLLAASALLYKKMFGKGGHRPIRS